MSVEEFREFCKKGRFYYFKTAKDFNNRIDYDGKKINNNIKFNRGLEDLGLNYPPPTRYIAYGVRN